MLKGVFFDLYGTLIDIQTDEEDPAVYAILSRYLSYHLVQIDPEALKKEYFEGIQAQLEKSRELYPEGDIYVVFSETMRRYGNRTYSQEEVVAAVLLFRSLTIRRFEAFPDLYDVLTSLTAKYKLALISDAQWAYTEPEIAMLGLDRFFPLRILSSRMGFKKPDFRLFDMAMKKFQVRPEECVYIGDMPRRDLVGAKKAGMKCILFRSDCESYDGFQPDRCFHDYRELENILQELG